MKNLFYLPLYAAIVLLGASCTGKKGNGSAPAERLARLEIDSIIDMGAFPSTSPLKSVDINIANTGDTTLFLTAAMPECDCTTIELTDSVLEPGERSKVRATLDLSEYIPPMTVEKRFAILCNSEHNRAIYVTLVGHLEK